MAANRRFARTLEQFSESGVLDGPSEHVGRMRTETRYEFHCALCKWEQKEEWRNASGGSAPEPDSAKEYDRWLVESIKRQILHKFTHQAVVYPDEVEGPGNAVGRAWMDLKNARIVKNGGDWRASQKRWQKGRAIHSWVMVEKEEADTNGREGKAETTRTD